MLYYTIYTLSVGGMFFCLCICMYTDNDHLFSHSLTVFVYNTSLGSHYERVAFLASFYRSAFH